MTETLESFESRVLSETGFDLYEIPERHTSDIVGSRMIASRGEITVYAACVTKHEDEEGPYEKVSDFFRVDTTRDWEWYRPKAYLELEIDQHDRVSASLLVTLAGLGEVETRHGLDIGEDIGAGPLRLPTHEYEERARAEASKVLLGYMPEAAAIDAASLVPLEWYEHPNQSLREAL